MLSGPKILVTAFLRAIVLIVIILAYVTIGFTASQGSNILGIVLNIAFAVTMASLFSFLTNVLIKIGERKIIIFSFAAFGLAILLTTLSILNFHHRAGGIFTIIIAVVMLTVVVNLFIQTLRMRPSLIRQYFRIISTTILSAYLIKTLNVPVLVLLFNFKPSPQNAILLQAIISLATLALNVIVGIAVILMITKLRRMSRTEVPSKESLSL